MTRHSPNGLPADIGVSARLSETGASSSRKARLCHAKV